MCNNAITVLNICTQMNDDIIIITQVFNVHKMSLIRLNTNHKTLKMNLRHGYNICSYDTKNLISIKNAHIMVLTWNYNIKSFSTITNGIRYDCCDKHLWKLGLTPTLPHRVHYALHNHSVRSTILQLFVFVILGKK